jgi:pimeloyl-ACP methyl ester carboxylesterase
MPREKQEAAMTQTVPSKDGTPIAFDRAGDGPPLVVVTGALADRSEAATLAPALPGFALYTYDRRGRGDSGDRPPYAVEREIEDLDAVIGAAGGEALVFGHSSGAVLALEAAARGLPITRLAVYEPPYILGDDRPRPLGLAARVRELVDAGERDAAVRAFLREAPQVPEKAVAAMAASPSWPNKTAMAHTLPYDLEICGDQVIPAGRMAAIAVPVLALSGGASPAWARDSVRALADAVPGARHASLEGQTHGVAPEVLAPVLVEFFTS